MECLFVDTGAWFAYFNGTDPDHESMVAALAEWEGRLITTDYVFDELITLIRLKVGHKAACDVGELLRSRDTCVMADVETSDKEQAWKRFVRDADKVYSFTDCTSFAVMKRLNLKTAAAVDSDFRRAGFVVLPAD